MGAPGLQSCKTRLANKSSSHYMYLLSPGGETLFLIPGVEVVHKAPAPITLPQETKGKIINQFSAANMEGKMQPPTQGGGRKRQNLTLDLNSASAKKNRVQNLLTSPDVQMLKLTSPELEKFLSQNPTLATPTPSGYIFPKSVTEEQMMYAKGFEEALEHLRQAETVPEGSNEATVAAANTLATLSAVHPNTVHPSTVHPLIVHPAPPSIQINQEHQVTSLPLSLPNTIPAPRPHSRPNSGASGCYDSELYAVPDGVKIKDEPDDLSLSGGESNYGPESMLSPNTSGMSPIDMESQEKIKLERKRLRNRLAASKCRKRKLERISQLDERVAQLKTENSDLAAVVKKMKSSVAVLKQEVMEHVNSGCEIRMTDANAFS